MKAERLRGERLREECPIRFLAGRHRRRVVEVSCNEEHWQGWEAQADAFGDLGTANAGHHDVRHDRAHVVPDVVG
jgi:hypothetical protein